jgi:malonyl-CoA/methylmalonyl-CoA synthetase
MILNLAQLLAMTAAQYAAKPAIIFDDVTWTYQDFDRAVARNAAVLSDLGLGPGDRVAIQLPKQMAFVFLHLAVLSLGAITLPLNPDYRSAEVEYFLSDSGAFLYITDGPRWAAVKDAIAHLPHQTLLVDEPGETGLNARLSQAGPFVRPYPTTADDVAMICYTSGTTGRSKGAMLTHGNLVSNMKALAKAWDWTDRDRLLHVLPLFHVHGLNVAVHGSLYAGATLIMQEKFNPQRAWEALAGCTQMMGVPTIYQRLIDAWDALEYRPDLSGMRVFISGSAPLPEPLFERFEQATGFRILERYGMTETGMNASNLLDPAGRKAKSVGFPLTGIAIRIVGADGQDVTPGSVGEVWIRGENVFTGYWAMAEKTAEAFVDGWFRSGDLGYQDPADGDRLYLVGRAKELIITGGMNVYPKEIENVLERLDGIQEAAVIGLPDRDFGERVVAVVVAPGLDPEALIAQALAHCRASLAAYKCPKQVVIVGALPRNAMGKLQKNRLVEEWGNADRQSA